MRPTRNLQVPWKTQGFPIDNNILEDTQCEGGPINTEDGTVCRFVDFAPQSSSPAHRTQSLDYGEQRTEKRRPGSEPSQLP